MALVAHMVSIFAPSDPATMERLRDIEIGGDVIRLGQLLTLSALADSGADTRELLLASVVTVNGDPEPAAPRRRASTAVVGRAAALALLAALSTAFEFAFA